MATPRLALRDLLAIEDPTVQRHLLSQMGPDQFTSVAGQVADLVHQQRKENQLRAYQPVSEHAKELHTLLGVPDGPRVVAAFGGNRSSKTESCIVHLAMAATGIIPDSIADVIDPETVAKPVAIRVVVESLTTTLPKILEKLQWYKWTGMDAPGGLRGHYGWIPRHHLLGGSWEKSWREKLRVLTVLHHHPVTGKVDGESTFQFLSKDNDPSDFASDEFHWILHDEPPHLAQWREDETRVMSLDGRMLLAMTWPDDPTIPCDWVFDEVWEPAQDPSQPNVAAVTLFSTDNPFVDQAAISAKAARWNEATRRVRIYGEPMRFSSLVHPLFTAKERTWCFVCRQPVSTLEGACIGCGSRDLEAFCHVEDRVPSAAAGAVFLLDMHPRKPHMMMWVDLDPADDYYQRAELCLSGDPPEVAKAVFEIEQTHGIRTRLRLCDPNMGRSPAGVDRALTWQDAFANAGLSCDLADDSGVGRQTFDAMLAPDDRTRRPRIAIHPRCEQTVHQMGRYQWDDFKLTAGREQKQQPKRLHDDFPTLWKYLMNRGLTYRHLRHVGIVNRGRPQETHREARWSLGA